MVYFQYLTDRVSMLAHAYTLYSSVRPFGASIILGSYEEDGAHMHVIDPSGVSWVINTGDTTTCINNWNMLYPHTFLDG